MCPSISQMIFSGPSDLFNHEIREERRDDLGAGCAFLFGITEDDELIFAFETSPKLLKLVRIKALLPLEMDQARATPRASPNTVLCGRSHRCDSFIRSPLPPLCILRSQSAAMLIQVKERAAPILSVRQPSSPQAAIDPDR